ncbi:MAG: hypothetical protein LBQ45_00070 [Mycoplasmataceae bacterium]|jgi:hypothetical protein|nr:hypothetical protein [Mycoplasmataceae bacterium]
MEKLELVIKEKANEVKQALSNKSNEWLRAFVQKAANNAEELTLDDMFVVEVINETLKERMVD